MEILIVDDDFVTRGLLKNMLQSAGHDVRIAENGAAGLEMVRLHQIRMVITDWMMPEMDGPQLCEAIRREDTGGYVFIIMLTSKDEKKDIISGLESGADDYLSKPFNHAELLARLKSGLRILDLEQSLLRANEEIRQLSITDPLTGCYNRGYLSSAMEKEIKRAMRYDRPLSLILCDIDHFKKINDTYGHQAGDRALQKFVQYLMTGVRQELDWVVRYGGEEFLVVLPETGKKDAVNVAERFRSEMCNLQLEIQENKIGFTASYGVSGVDRWTEDLRISVEDLIKKTDDSLYQAKEEGRNRVVCDSSPFFS